MARFPIETITHNDQLLAIILDKDFHADGITFFTGQDSPLQLGYMSHPEGHEIIPHVHNPISRKTTGTHEVLFIKKGAVEVDFFSYEQEYLESRTLRAGDFVFLVGAGHGMTMLEPTTIVEIKNGPYFPDQDKKHFPNPRRQK